MHYSIEKLLGGADVSEWFVAAKDHWEESLSDEELFDTDRIAVVADNEQFWFEENCGGRRIGQEIMVWAGICRFYTTAVGFEDENLTRARNMVKGLLASNCSMEIKYHAESVVESYDDLADESGDG